MTSSVLAFNFAFVSDMGGLNQPIVFGRTKYNSFSIAVPPLVLVVIRVAPFVSPGQPGSRCPGTNRPSTKQATDNFSLQ